MSVEAASGEGAEGIPLFDGEVRLGDRVNETITGIARQVIHFNSFMRQSWQLIGAPLHSGEYGQNHSAIQECVRRGTVRLMCFPTWMTSLSFIWVAAIVTSIGNLVHSSLYRTTQGTFRGDVHKDPKVGLLNPRMSTGVAPQKQGGVAIASLRFERVVATIRDNDPDVLFLPEVNRFNAPYLASSLQDRYHFFFTGMGERMLGEDTSFFIGFRGNLVKAPEYIPFRKQDWSMERGYFIMDTVDRTYVCTYNPTREDWGEILGREYGSKRVVLMGEMEPEDQEILIEKGFVSGIPKGTATTTSAPFAHYHGVEEGASTSIPFLFFSKMEGKTHVVPMHDAENIGEALSDHSLILHR